MNVQRIANVLVGKPDTTMSKSSHVPGVREGNRGGAMAARPMAAGRRSTGINARDREPIDPRMPVLTPA